MKKLLVTSALPYANGPIHIGHLVEYVQTDIFVRHWRSRGRDVVYVCADDTHGTPIMMRARDEGIAPEDLIARTWQAHTRDFAGCLIEFDNYYSTHSEENRQLSCGIYEALRDGGHVHQKEIEQAYCPRCGTFLPDRFIRGACPRCAAPDQYGDSCEVCSATYGPRDLAEPFCATCGSTPEWRLSRHLFFRLSDFAPRLQAWLRSGHVQEEVANKLQEWFAEGLKDWDISRDAPYFGFEIPGEPGKYFYVWLDAPIGYMASSLELCRRTGRDWEAYWKGEDTELYHFIGKDIVYFHALFWPATLMGSGHRTPTRLCVHGFLTVNGEKMSKSRGTFITAENYLKFLDPEYLRYYFATKLTGRVEDLDLDFDDFVDRVNADLVNKLANIPSRLLAILHRNCGGRLARLDEGGRVLLAAVRGRCDEAADLFERREFAQATRLIGDLAGEVNRYIQANAPWDLVKTDAAQAAVVCTAALNAFRVIATLLAPILPRFGATVARMLGVARLDWAGLDEVLEDRPVLPYERLAERVDRKRIEALLDASGRPAPGAKEEPAPVLSAEALVETAFVPLRVAAVGPVEGADALVRLTLDDPAGPRPVVAGIGRDHLDGRLVGRRVLVVANLEPKTLKGVESRGMILAAKTAAGVLPVEPVDGR